MPKAISGATAIALAAYPCFAARHRQRPLPASALSLAASGLTIYVPVTTLQEAST